MKIIINGEIVEAAEGGSGPSTPVTPITSAEYEALSDADKQADVAYLITDDNEGGDSGGGSSEEIYSTEEVRIGTWIDGKPLYRKTFVVENPIFDNTNATSNCSIVSANDFDKIGVDVVTSIRGILYGSGLEHPLPYISMGIAGTSISTYTMFQLVHTDRSGLFIAYASTNKQSANYYKVVVILEYTKTTDTGGAA